MPTAEQVAAARTRLEQVAAVGARHLAAGDNHEFIGYAVRVIDIALAELAAPTPRRSGWPGYRLPVERRPPPYDWSSDDGG